MIDDVFIDLVIDDRIIGSLLSHRIIVEPSG